MRPPGNPDAMRRAAQEMNSVGMRMGAVGAMSAVVLPTAVFEGPGRAQHEGQLGHVRSQLAGASSTLSQTASRLMNEADRLEEAQRRYDAKVRAEAAMAKREAMRRQQQGLR